MRKNKSRESPLGIYLGLLIHTKTRKRKLIEKFHDLGISISYQRVMDLSTEMGNKVLNSYEEQNLLYPPSLKLNLFTTSALDNIDHNPSSTTSEDSFHGTETSLFQHQDHKDDGLDQVISESAQMKEKKKLSNLPECYAEFRPVSKFNDKPGIKDYASVDIDAHFKDENEDVSQLEKK